MKYLKEVDEEKAFHLGHKKIRSLDELLSAVKELSESEFNHYASENHNYFADWVLHVIQYKRLSKKLRGKSQKSFEKALEKEIEKLKKPKEKKKSVKTEEIVDSFTVSGTEKPKIEEENEDPVEEPTKEAPDTKTMLESIAEDEREIKQFLWKHFAWDMAKEFMYGLAIGILIGFVLSKIFLRV